MGKKRTFVKEKLMRFAIQNGTILQKEDVPFLYAKRKIHPSANRFLSKIHTEAMPRQTSRRWELSAAGVGKANPVRHS